MHYAYHVSDSVEAIFTLLMGELDVTADDVDELTIDITPSRADRPANVRAVENTVVGFDHGRLTVTQRRESMFSTWVNKSWSVDVHVRMPRQSRLTVTSSYGGIRVRGPIDTSSLTLGYGNISVAEAVDLTAKTSHGDVDAVQLSGTSRLTGTNVRMGEVYGDVTAKTSHGSVGVGLVMGTIDAASGYGNVDLGTVMGDVQARVSHGRIRLADAIRGSAGLDAKYGDVQVGIRQGTLAWLDLDARAGTVRNELDDSGPASDDEATDRFTVTARTGYGSVRAFRAAVL